MLFCNIIWYIITLGIKHKYSNSVDTVTQSARAVEYMDCISAEG